MPRMTATVNHFRSALLAAILAEPESDLPRLVYADWLDENGEPGRAELIRAQCDRKCLPEGWSQLRELPSCGFVNLSIEEHGHGNYVLATKVGGVTGFIDHGFVVELRGPLPALMEHGPAIVAENPVERASVTGRTPFGEYAFGTFGPDTTPEQFRIAVLAELRLRAQIETERALLPNSHGLLDVVADKIRSVVDVPVFIQ